MNIGDLWFLGLGLGGFIGLVLMTLGLQNLRSKE
jgi:hypothetical protein